MLLGEFAFLKALGIKIYLIIWASAWRVQIRSFTADYLEVKCRDGIRLWLSKFEICGDKVTNQLLTKYHNFNNGEMKSI